MKIWQVKANTTKKSRIETIDGKQHLDAESPKTEPSNNVSLFKHVGFSLCLDMSNMTKYVAEYTYSTKKNTQEQIAFI